MLEILLYLKSIVDDFIIVVNGLKQNEIKNIENITTTKKNNDFLYTNTHSLKNAL